MSEFACAISLQRLHRRLLGIDCEFPNEQLPVTLLIVQGQFAIAPRPSSDGTHLIEADGGLEFAHDRLHRQVTQDSLTATDLTVR